jgi:hypothetical protein
MKTGRKGIKTVLLVIFLLFLIVFAGFLRDYLFKSINALLRAWDYDQDYFLPAPLSFLENYEYDTLVNMKWMLTFLFSFIYLFISIASLKMVFGDHRYRRLCIYTYAAVMLLSGIFIGCGMLFSKPEKMYEFARYLMGMAQSPLVLMILIPALKLSEKEKNKSKSS